MNVRYGPTLVRVPPLREEDALPQTWQAAGISGNMLAVCRKKTSEVSRGVFDDVMTLLFKRFSSKITSKNFRSL